METEEPEEFASSGTTRASDKFIVRFPEGMRDRIAVRAKLHKRSMNAEVVDLIERGFEYESLNEAYEVGRRWLNRRRDEDRWLNIGVEEQRERETRLVKVLMQGIEGQAMVLHILAHYLREVGRRIPAEAEDVRQLLEGLHLERRSPSELVKMAATLVDRGKAIGIIPPDSPPAYQPDEVIQPPSEFPDLIRWQREKISQEPHKTVRAHLQPDGTLLLATSNIEWTKKELQSAGIDLFVTIRGGIVVGVSQAEKARKLFPEQWHEGIDHGPPDRRKEAHDLNSAPDAAQDIRSPEGDVLFARDAQGRLINAPQAGDFESPGPGSAEPDKLTRTEKYGAKPRKK